MKLKQCKQVHWTTKIKTFVIAGFLTSTTFIISSCEKTTAIVDEENELLDGPLSTLSPEENKRFLKGDEAFVEIFTAGTGLGPVFVANQCASCHAGDGKGTPFVEFIRFGQADTNGNTYLNAGGPQLQHKAIPGHKAESLPLNAPFTRLIAPAVTGLGFLDAVSDADLISLSDPYDSDGDGISGRVHWNTIPNYVELRPNSIAVGNRYITRFGKKGAAYDLLHQTAGAYNQDMGITSSFEPIDVATGQLIEPEVSNQTVHDLVFYLKTLKAPLRRNIDDPNVIAGEALFQQIDCGKCHVSQLKTGPSPISSLSYKTFYPYTDLLLHDMGSGLDDGYTEGKALTSEWKTPALWGLGLSKNSQGGIYYLLHDGRATSIHQAITLHGGEALNSKNQYIQLSNDEQNQLIEFLESL